MVNVKCKKSVVNEYFLLTSASPTDAIWMQVRQWAAAASHFELEYAGR